MSWASAGTRAAQPLDTRRVGVMDGLRCLMVFLISWYHIWQQSWLTPAFDWGGRRISLDFLVRTGYMMVDGLILMSGFLLFLPYARFREERAPMPRAGAFYLRRLVRIVPSYYFCILVFLGIALAGGAYSSGSFLLKDLLTHLTFTHTFFQDTYHQTQLNGAAWTLAVEMQAYLIFPWIAGAYVKRPFLMFLALCLTGFSFRAGCMYTLTDYSMTVNQLPAFLDVYALGMGAALCYVKGANALNRRTEAGKGRGLRIWISLAALLASCLCVGGIVLVLKAQARMQQIQAGQMQWRFPFALLTAGLFLSLGFTFRPVRFLFSNRAARFFAVISLNYYLWHQALAVWLKKARIPAYIQDQPHVAREQPWQARYTLVCFFMAAAAAALLTFAVEKPGAKALKKLFAGHKNKRMTNCKEDFQ